MDWASYFKNTNVLNWWKDSGLKIKYGLCAVDWVSYYGHVDILDWWKNSKLKLFNDGIG